MGINIRTKGQQGEREVCQLLENLARPVLAELGYNIPYDPPLFQRNQNQSAVGGSDITNPFNLCIEVKRQEQLNINAWWKQCKEASEAFGGVPIVMYRQNGKRKWNVVMEGFLPIPVTKQLHSRVFLGHDEFETWFKTYINYFVQEHGYES